MKKAKKKKSKFLILLRWLSSLSIIAVLLWVMYIYAGKLLCQIALGQIGEITNTKIVAGSIKYMSNGSVEFTDLVVKPCEKLSNNCEIIRAKRLFASFDKKSLFLLHPVLDVIDVNDFVFNAVYDVDTNWSNLSGLKIKPTGGKIHKAPDIHLGSGTLQYIKVVNGREEIALSVPVDADFKSNEDAGKMYHFNITTATMSSGHGLSRLQGFWEPGHVIVTGGVSSLSVPEFEMAWFINVSAAEFKYDKDNNYSLALTIKDMESLRNNEPNVLDLEIPPFVQRTGLISSMQKFLDEYKPKGLMDINLDVSGNLHEIADSKINGTVHCRDIAFTFSKFQYPIKHLVGNIDFTHDSISYNNLIGKHGDSELTFSGWCKNLGPDRQIRTLIQSDNLPLEDDLYQALKPNQQKFWSSFSPEGNISVDVQIERSPETGRSANVKVGLLDVDATYDNFPYPLNDLSGELIFEPDKIVVQNALSRNKDIEILVNGEINNLKSENASFDMIIDVNNVPMDSTLEASLPEGLKEIYKSFNPNGLTEGSVIVSRAQTGDIDYIADLNFIDASIKMDFLEKPVKNLFANVVLSPDSAVIKSLSGNYGDMPVLLSGHFMSGHEKQLGYDVSLNLKRVQLNDKELQSLLPDSIKETVQRFDPNGMTDMILDLKKSEPNEPVDYTVIVNCLGNSIYLEDFNSPVTDVTGIMVIDSDNVQLKDVTAFFDIDTNENKKEKIVLDGNIQLDEGSIKQAELNFAANNITFKERIIERLPDKCLNLYKALLPTGSIDVEFNKFKLLNDTNDIKTISFDGEINLGNCDFILSDKPAKIDSIVKIQGVYNTEKGFCDCKMVVDGGDLNIFDKNLTDLRTEINYDPNQQKWVTKYLLADLYSGKTSTQLELIHQENSPMKYVLETAFENVDLEKFLADANDNGTEDNASARATGKMSGALSISSELPTKNSRIGSCKVSIKNMKVGKMSPFAQLFQVLNLTEPSEYAFDSMLINSYIKRNNLVVEKLDMSGKSVAFYGSGLISLANGDVDLSLTARGPRLATDDPPFFQSLTENLGQALIRMEVTGDYHNLKVVTKTLPVIEGALMIFGEPRTEN